MYLIRQAGGSTDELITLNDPGHDLTFSHQTRSPLPEWECNGLINRPTFQFVFQCRRRLSRHCKVQEPSPSCSFGQDVSGRSIHQGVSNQAVYHASPLYYIGDRLSSTQSYIIVVSSPAVRKLLLAASIESSSSSRPGDCHPALVFLSIAIITRPSSRTTRRTLTNCCLLCLARESKSVTTTRNVFKCLTAKLFRRAHLSKSKIKPSIAKGFLES